KEEPPDENKQGKDSLLVKEVSLPFDDCMHDDKVIMGDESKRKEKLDLQVCMDKQNEGSQEVINNHYLVVTNATWVGNECKDVGMRAKQEEEEERVIKVPYSNKNKDNPLAGLFMTADISEQKKGPFYYEEESKVVTCTGGYYTVMASKPRHGYYHDELAVHSRTSKVVKQTNDIQGLEEDHEDISYMHLPSMKLSHHYERSTSRINEVFEHEDFLVQNHHVGHSKVWEPSVFPKDMSSDFFIFTLDFMESSEISELYMANTSIGKHDFTLGDPEISGKGVFLSVNDDFQIERFVMEATKDLVIQWTRESFTCFDDEGNK
ncbi:hypothetical protein KI387_012371, partial [Taxus chinensis]